MRWPWTKDDRPSNATLEPAAPRKRRRRRSGLRLGLGQLLLVLGFTVATTAAGVYTVYSQYQVVKLGYALDQQLFDYRRELEASKRLNLSISSYKHPSAVRAFADEALDMRQPSNADELIVPAPPVAPEDMDDELDESVPTMKVEGAADPVLAADPNANKTSKSGDDTQPSKPNQPAGPTPKPASKTPSPTPPAGGDTSE